MSNLQSKSQLDLLAKNLTLMQCFNSMVALSKLRRICGAKTFRTIKCFDHWLSLSFIPYPTLKNRKQKCYKCFWWPLPPQSDTWFTFAPLPSLRVEFVTELVCMLELLEFVFLYFDSFVFSRWETWHEEGASWGKGCTQLRLFNAT